MPDRALEGLKVVEFGSFISAPYCGKLLADLGAEVIKIEPPKVGDEARRFGPFPGDVPHLEKSGFFIYLNGNKLGVTLNPSTATGFDIFTALVADADVLVENQQPGVLKALGLDYDRLSKVNPGLVMTSITTFGRTGPYRDYKGYDLTAWHGSGVAHRYVGEPDREPLRGAWYHADHWSAVAAAAATTIALAARDLTGEGQLVDISETDILATHLMGYQIVTLYHLTGEHEARAGVNAVRTGAPVGMYACKDGYVFIMPLELHHWHGLVRAMGSPDWALDPIFDVPSHERAEYAQEIDELMQPWFDERTKEEIFVALQAERVPCGPFYNAGDIVEHQHMNARGFFAEMDHPVLGRVQVPGRPYVLSETPWGLRQPAPTLGQHNQLIYGGRLGFSNVDLTDLRRTAII
ncbi:MAG: CoA transferase [Dehalococcoidia bacterium]